MLIPAGPGQAYCIDQTEVTVGQYQAFLDTKPALPQTQPPMCKDNVTYFGPTKEVEESAFAAIDPVNHPDEPMGMVDWCDAYAYCAWAGKRLCGKVGGGPVGQIGEYATVASEWYNACSNGGKTKYPYGDSFDVSKCWVTGHEGAPADSAKPVPASSDAVAACHGQQAPYSEIVNLSGNVYEWENSLDPSEASAQSYYSASALIRGGVVGSDAAQVQLETSCAFGGPADRALLARGVGLRCCADAVPLP